MSKQPPTHEPVFQPPVPSPVATNSEEEQLESDPKEVITTTMTEEDQMD